MPPFSDTNYSHAIPKARFDFVEKQQKQFPNDNVTKGLTQFNTNHQL